MCNIWKICAVAILITGSISSTSGATECTRSIPEGAISLDLPGDPKTGEVEYREEVRHPALPFPKVATGSLRIGTNGRLIRHQLTPDIEIVEIGETVLTVRKGEEAQPNMLPIPEQMQGLFGFLRSSFSGGKQQVTLDADNDRVSDPAGWRTTLGTYEGETSIWLLGCGTRLAGFLVRNGDGIERRTILGTAPVTGAGLTE